MRLNLRKLSKIKAFTLTELLVVVVIIGVLAAVALPKFNRVIETRRTGEAEEMLSAIRMEQEKRCTLDQPYAGYFDKLGDFIASESKTPKTSTDNYEYSLGVMGASAQRNGKDYQLSIPSYADGRLCCTGDYCKRLNKNYPLCNEMIDLTASVCSAPLCEVARECTPGETSSQYCECGSETRSCDNSCQWGSYSGSCYSQYGGSGKTTICSSGCGSQTSISTCYGEELQGSCWSPSGAKSESKNCSEIQSNLRGTTMRSCGATCSGTPDCPMWGTAGCSVCSAPAGEPSSQPCPAGQIGTQTRTWDSSACAWGAWTGECTCEAPAGEPTTQPCASGFSGNQTRVWDSSACAWGAWMGECTCAAPAGQPTSKACPSGFSGNQTRVWDSSTCAWGAWTGLCTCVPPAGEPSRMPCPAGQIGTLTRTWDSMICGWDEWAGECTCDAPPAGEPSSQPCPAGFTGNQTRVWNSMSCAWEEWWTGECTCEAPAGQPTSKACPSGFSGNQTRVWDADICEWSQWETKWCVEQPKYCCQYKETWDDVESNSKPQEFCNKHGHIDCVNYPQTGWCVDSYTHKSSNPPIYVLHKRTCIQERQLCSKVSGWTPC